MTGNTQDAATIAGEAFDWFETRTRDDDTTYTTLKDGRPDWIYDAVYAAHGNMLPVDWVYDAVYEAHGYMPPDDRIYRLCRNAFGFIHGNDATEDDQSEFADQAVDVYTMDRLRWLASHLSRPGLCDEAADEMGADGLGIVERIGLGQYVEAQGVYAVIFAACEEQAA